MLVFSISLTDCISLLVCSWVIPPRQTLDRGFAPLFPLHHWAGLHPRFHQPSPSSQPCNVQMHPGAYFSGPQHCLLHLFALIPPNHPLLGCTSYSQSVAHHDHHQLECPVILFCVTQKSVVCHYSGVGCFVEGGPGTWSLPVCCNLVGITGVPHHCCHCALWFAHQAEHRHT